MTLFVATLGATLLAFLAWRYLERLLDWLDPSVGNLLVLTGSTAAVQLARHGAELALLVIAAVLGLATAIGGWWSGSGTLTAGLAGSNVFVAGGTVVLRQYANVVMSGYFLLMNIGLWIRTTTLSILGEISPMWHIASAAGTLLALCMVGLAYLRMSRQHPRYAR